MVHPDIALRRDRGFGMQRNPRARTVEHGQIIGAIAHGHATAIVHEYDKVRAARKLQ